MRKLCLEDLIILTPDGYLKMEPKQICLSKIIRARHLILLRIEEAMIKIR